MFTTLISAEQLLSTHDVAIFDCRFDLAHHNAGKEAYSAGHIPNAVYLDLEHDLSGEKNGHNGRHPLPNPQQLIATLRRHGVSNTTQVIAYDAQGGLFAARLWWLLRWMGHEAVAVLDGGLQAWQAAGGTLNTAQAEPLASGDFSLRPSLQPLAKIDDVVANLKNQHAQIIDARSPDRFRGENETLDPVGGHIPGAINRFFKDNLQANGQFKPASQLNKEWSTVLGYRRAEETIHQCGSGVTACHNLLALHIADLAGATLYAGSWSEWCADPSRPVATQ